MRNYKKILSEKYNMTKFNKPGKSFDYVEQDLNEKLYGNQNRIDMDKNGRLTKRDFEMLHNKKETSEGNAFTNMLRKTKKGEKFKMGGKEYTDNSSLDEDETIYELEMSEDETCECGSGMRESECTECGKSGDVFEMYEGETCECGSGMRESECTECGKMSSDILEFEDEGYFDDADRNWDEFYKDEEDLLQGEKPCNHCNGTGYDEFNDVECDWCGGEGFIDDDLYKGKEKWGSGWRENPETDFESEIYEDSYDNAEKTKGFWDKGKKSFSTNVYEYEIFNNDNGKSFRLTEEQVVNLIENLAEEKLKPTKKTRGYSEYEKNFDKSGKENKDYYKEVGKKMKNYMDKGSKETFNMEPKHFPMGNGELEKMDKMAYVPSDSVAEYVENFTAAGLENIDTDEIGFNEEWVESNIVGSSKTGNNPEWANAVETPVNKKRNEIREKNMLAQIKRKAYKKSPQPTVKDRPGTDDASDLLNRVENDKSKKSKKSKDSKKINEDLERIGNLISYNRKTQ